jgi:hypothetical protein
VIPECIPGGPGHLGSFNEQGGELVLGSRARVVPGRVGVAAVMIVVGHGHARGGHYHHGGLGQDDLLEIVRIVVFWGLRPETRQARQGKAEKQSSKTG